MAVLITLVSTMQRVQEALLELYGVVEADLKIMKTGLDSYKIGYDTYHKPCLDHYRRSLHDKQPLFAYYAGEFAKNKTAFSVTKEEILSTVKFAEHYVTCYKKYDQSVFGRNDVPIIYDTFPSDEFVACFETLIHLSKTFKNFSSTFREGHIETAAFFETFATRIPFLSKCIFNYGTNLEKMSVIITDVERQINKITLDISTLDLNLTQILADEMRYLQRYFQLYSNDVIKFRTLEITQYELGDHFNQSTITQYELLINHIIEKLDKQGNYLIHN